MVLGRHTPLVSQALNTMFHEPVMPYVLVISLSIPQPRIMTDGLLLGLGIPLQWLEARDRQHDGRVRCSCHIGLVRGVYTDSMAGRGS